MLNQVTPEHHSSSGGCLYSAENYISQNASKQDLSKGGRRCRKGLWEGFIPHGAIEFHLPRAGDVGDRLFHKSGKGQ